MIRPDAAAALEDPLLLRAMPRYIKVVKGVLPARYVLARMVPSTHSQDSSTEELLKEHSSLLNEEVRLMEEVDCGRRLPQAAQANSLLDLKALLAARMLEDCQLCERRCRVDRTGGELGYCRIGVGMGVTSAFVHMGEEPEIVPSYTVCGL